MLDARTKGILDIFYRRLVDAIAAGDISGIISEGSLPDSVFADISTERIVDGAVTAEKLAPGSAIPSGAVMAFAMEIAPSGWLECDGSEVSRETYSSLFSAIGVVNGEGDGSTTFNLPDLRGRFVRGWDHGATNDPDSSGRIIAATGGATGDSVGSYQVDAYKAHTHTTTALSTWPFDDDGPNLDATVISGSTNTGSSGGSETRPKNINLMYCIKT